MIILNPGDPRGENELWQQRSAEFKNENRSDGEYWGKLQQRSNKWEGCNWWIKINYSSGGRPRQKTENYFSHFSEPLPKKPRTCFISMSFKQLLELFTVHVAEHMTSTTEANERLMLSSHCSDVVYVSFSYFTKGRRTGTTLHPLVTIPLENTSVNTNITKV